MLIWEKIDHFTGEPYKKKNNGSWQIVDYISGCIRISELPNGHREVTKSGQYLGEFKTLKSAKAFAETL